MPSCCFVLFVLCVVCLVVFCSVYYVPGSFITYSVLDCVAFLPKMCYYELLVVVPGMFDYVYFCMSGMWRDVAPECFSMVVCVVGFVFCFVLCLDCLLLLSCLFFLCVWCLFYVCFFFVVCLCSCCYLFVPACDSLCLCSGMLHCPGMVYVVHSGMRYYCPACVVRMCLCVLLCVVLLSVCVFV